MDLKKIPIRQLERTSISVIRRGRDIYEDAKVRVEAKTRNATYYKVGCHSVINDRGLNGWKCDCHWASNRPPERWGYCVHVTACMIFKNETT